VDDGVIVGVSVSGTDVWVAVGGTGVSVGGSTVSVTVGGFVVVGTTGVDDWQLVINKAVTNKSSQMVGCENFMVVELLKIIAGILSQDGSNGNDFG